MSCHPLAGPTHVNPCHVRTYGFWRPQNHDKTAINDLLYTLTSTGRLLKTHSCTLRHRPACGISRGEKYDVRSQMTTSTFLAMSTGAMVAIIFGMGLPLFVILFVMRNKKKNP